MNFTVECRKLGYIYSDIYIAICYSNRKLDLIGGSYMQCIPRGRISYIGLADGTELLRFIPPKNTQCVELYGDNAPTKYHDTPMFRFFFYPS